ncbi:MAG: serine protein kinase PrkA [Desulfobacterales bacterium]
MSDLKEKSIPTHNDCAVNGQSREMIMSDGRESIAKAEDQSPVSSVDLETAAEHIQSAVANLDRNLSSRDQRSPISFDAFLKKLTEKPTVVIRNIFQVFHDMVTTYVGKGYDEYPDDPESISYIYYDCNKLFVEGVDHPFFADRLFANRLISLVDAMKRGTQQNKIYMFRGPHGCGKSTFLNNLLMKFEEYNNTDEGLRYETLWRLDPKMLGDFPENQTIPVLDTLSTLQERLGREQYDLLRMQSMLSLNDEFVEVPCPSHDNPFLMIPKAYRRTFFDELFENDEFKWKLYTEKEYEWVFRDNPCTICSSLFHALLERLESPRKVFEMIYARPYRFDRRQGEGISVYNPGDHPLRQITLSNPFIQSRINALLRDSNLVRYIFSQYAKTNNGIYALMDIKSHNTERMIELHNIISEGIHKVEDIEENVNSLLMAVMNPEDQKNIADFQSFSDRIEYINIPYVMDLNTEVEIYRNIFGKHIDDSFLPRVLHNFARVIISTRLNKRSDAMLEWIGDPEKYRLYCDENLQLLKMEIYTGYIPNWLGEKDRKRLTAKRRRKIIAESEAEGEHGISGRDSIKIFNEFYSSYSKDNKLINMSQLCNFFTKSRKELSEMIPGGFLDSLLRMYDYTILQEVKESLYYYNEEQISRDIQNYLFAVNFEPGSVATCTYTGEKLEITDDFFENLERRFLGPKADNAERQRFRSDTQREYTSKSLTQEMMVEGKPLTATRIYSSLHERYVYNLKEKVLDPFLENENFRRAIKDYGEEDYKTYDKKIRDDVSYLITNLCKNFQYAEQGAREVCIYVIDSDLARKFAKT